MTTTDTQQGSSKAKVQKKQQKMKFKALPYSSALGEVKVELPAKALAALEKEAEAQSRGKRFGKLTASDVLTAMVYEMGQGPTIKSETKKAVTFVIPAAAQEILQACADRNGVTVDRIIEELGNSL